MMRVLRFSLRQQRCSFLAPLRRKLAMHATPSDRTVKLFLCGDVMLGRGVDQIMAQPCPPNIYECACTSACDYVELAERASGAVPRKVSSDYVWGAALQELATQKPDLRIINLETSVTLSEDAWKGKGIHYRMSPVNCATLSSLGVSCAVLANNHTLDWGYKGLEETTKTLCSLGIRPVGAGANAKEAAAPAILQLSHDRRVLVFAWGLPSAGVPTRWRATSHSAGVNYLPDLSHSTTHEIANQVRAVKRSGSDVAIASLHWGGNWEYEITGEQRVFAHRLIDEAGIDVVYGHSSHHAKGIEVYNNKLVLYGCGDWISDYEGISGFEEFRGDLGLMYFPTIDVNHGTLLDLTMTPTQVRRMRINRPDEQDVEWLREVLNREGRRLGTQVRHYAGNRLQLC